MVSWFRKSRSSNQGAGEEVIRLYRTLWFTHEAHQQLMQFAALASDGLETGGALFGYYYSTLGYAVVMEVTGPGPGSVRTWNRFTIGEEACRAARRQHERGYIIEVGDWHTHPVPVPEPSTGDDAGQRWYREQVKWAETPDALVIVGVPPGGTPQQVGAWYYTPDGRHQLEIRVAEEGWVPPIDQDGNWTGAAQGAGTDSA